MKLSQDGTNCLRELTEILPTCMKRSRSEVAVEYYEACIGLLQRLGETKRESFVLANASFHTWLSNSKCAETGAAKLEILENPKMKDQAVLWIQNLEQAVLGKIDLAFEGDMNSRRALVVSTQ